MKKKNQEWIPPKCSSGKVAYRSQGKAIYALKVIEADNAQAVAPIEESPRMAYKCRCGAWHLTKRLDGVAA